MGSFLNDTNYMILHPEKFGCKKENEWTVVSVHCSVFSKKYSVKVKNKKWLLLMISDYSTLFTEHFLLFTEHWTLNTVKAWNNL